MKCRNCGKEVDELEIFCEECKKELKTISSRQEVSELEKLIEDQNELNKLEDTKVLDDLNDLVEEELEKTNEQNEEIEKPKTRIARNENNPVEKKSKKKLIIVLSIVGILLVALIIALILILPKKNKPKEEEVVINYETVINEYGKSIEKTVRNYIEGTNEIPTWQQIIEINKYKKYEVVCDIHNVYSDGNIYLNECKVNNEKTKFSYGKEQIEEKEGKKINIYKMVYTNENYAYSSKNEAGSILVGTITCKTENCIYETSYDKYTIVKEEGRYYIYNYENNSMVFGPFDLSGNYEYENVLSDNHTLYGVYFNENGVNKLYNIGTNKVLENLSGMLYNDGSSNKAAIMYKYNYAILINKDIYNFVNLKTGNVSYTIKGNFGDFIEDKNNKIVYMTIYNDTEYNKFKIYNSNGKALFDEKEFKNFILTKDSLIVANETEYKIYDTKLNLKLSSKKYDSILGLYDKFIVVVDNKYLEVVDFNDKVLTKFDLKWDSSKYVFNKMLSGWYKEGEKEGIYLVIENITIPSGNKGSLSKYYYIPNSKEKGVIETAG